MELPFGLSDKINKLKNNITSEKIKENKVYLGLALGLYLFVLLIGCHVSIATTDSANIFEALIGGLSTFVSGPFRLSGLFNREVIPHLLRAVGITTLATMFALAWFFIEAEKFKNTMRGKEAGTADWNKDLAGYNKVYSDPQNSPENNGPYNMILTQNVFLNMHTFITRRNNNVCIVGGSGSGKSRFFVKPNILQANTNYVITDPAGELLMATGEFLKQEGYEIKVFNLVEMAKSDCYNPFNYIRDDLGVLMMINCLIKNTTPDGKGGGDPFWEKSETALLQALCFYLIKYRPKSEQNFTSVMKLLRAAEVNEQNPNAKSKLDRIFDEVAKTDPNSIALKQYQTFKMGAGKTLKSILISCSVRLTVFNLRQIESLTGRDTIDLGGMGTGKKALFVIIPAADSTYNFLVSMMYSQLFETLYFVAETTTTNKRLDRHVRFLLDEFANIGQIPEFTQKLATMRKYEISCNIILQNLAQIKTMYKDDWQTIIGNCDSLLFLGGQEYDTLKYFSDILGDRTIKSINTSKSYGGKGGSSLSRSEKGRKLMFPDEIARMDNANCILIIRGEKPFFGKKYEYTAHPNYHLTGDASDELKYINNINNTIIATPEEIEVSNEKSRVLKITSSSTGPSPQNKLIGDTQPVENWAKSLNIKKREDIFSRFVVIPTNNVTTPTNNISSSKTNVSATAIKKDNKENTKETLTFDQILENISKNNEEKEEIIKQDEIMNENDIEKAKDSAGNKSISLPSNDEKNTNEAEEWTFNAF